MSDIVIIVCLFIYVVIYRSRIKSTSNTSDINVYFLSKQRCLKRSNLNQGVAHFLFKFNECKFTTVHWQYSTEKPLKRHLIKSLLSRLFSSIVFCLDPTLTQREISRVKQIKVPRLVGGSQTHNVQNIVRHTHSKPIGTPIGTSVGTSE